MPVLDIVSLILACCDAGFNCLAAIKRRYDAECDFALLVDQCREKLLSIHTITSQLSTTASHAPLLSTVLRQRLEKLADIKRRLKKLKREVSRAPLAVHVWKSQDYAKALRDIANDLDQLQLAVENAVLHFETRNVVELRMEEGMACIDATVRKAGHRTAAVKLNRQECKLLPRVPLSTRDYKLLARYGQLHKLPLRESLYEAYLNLQEKSAKWAERKSLQFLRVAADLLDEDANGTLGRMYEFGYGVEKDLTLAVTHYHASGILGNHYAARAYFTAGEHKKARKELMFIEKDHDCTREIFDYALTCWLGLGTFNRNVEEANKYAKLGQQDPFVRSVCHFFGIGSSPDREKALIAYESCSSNHFRRTLPFVYNSMGEWNELSTKYFQLTMFDRPYLLDYSYDDDAIDTWNSAFRSFFGFLVDEGHICETQILAAIHLTEGITRDVQRAKRCFQRGARHGLIECQLWLALHYQEKKRTRRAEYYFRLAMEVEYVPGYIDDLDFERNKEHARRSYIELYDSKRAVSRVVKDTPENEDLKKRKKSRKSNKTK